MPAITPQEAQVGQAKGENIPEFVLEIVNGLIRKKYNPHQFTILFDEIVDEILAHQNVQHKNDLPKNWLEWMDFEPVYRAQGWRVVFQKPAYNESSSDQPRQYRFSQERSGT